MNIKKLILAVAVVYAVLMGTNYLVHEVWLMADYRAIPESWRTLADMRHKMWIMFPGQLFFAAMFSFIYTRGRENRPWLAQGIRYGVVMTFTTVVPYSLSEFVTYRIPDMLAVKWMIAGTIQLIILGLIVAGIFRQPPSKP
jgi:hypothetical protein